MCADGLSSRTYRRRHLSAGKPFLQHHAPGIILFLNKAKKELPKGNFFLLNAAAEFVKGDPKNYLPEHAIAYRRNIHRLEEIEKYSRIVTREEIAKNDFNISPSRYIHTGADAEHRPIREIVEELEALEQEAKETDAILNGVLAKIMA